MSLLNDSQFIVEDGTGLEDATSYVDVASANNYLENVSRPNLTSFSSDTDEQAKSYLNTAALFIDNSYCFKASKLNETQALQFPRTGQSEVPINVKYAQIEVALLIKNGKIYTNPGGSTTGKVIERRVGPITTKFAEEATGKTPSNPRQVNLLDFVEELLKPFFAETITNNFIRG